MTNHTVLIPIADDDALAELEAEFLKADEPLPGLGPIVAPEIPGTQSRPGVFGAGDQIRITRMTSSSRCCR